MNATIHTVGEWNGYEEGGVSRYDDAGGVWGFIKQFRWNINFFIVGIPYIFVMIACVIWNLVMNIFWFKGWAGGNFWLLG